MKLQIKDRTVAKRTRGMAYNGETALARATRELSKCVGVAGRWAIVDMSNGKVLAVSSGTGDTLRADQTFVW